MEPEPITVSINGERKEVAADQSIATLLEELGISADTVAVELNKSIVRRRDWKATVVPNDSELEIVEFVGGG